MYDIEDIRENYKNFYDEKIIQIAQNESKGLRPEVLEILKDEIIKRNLDRTLIIWVETESKPITDYEKETLKNIIENLPCPTCQGTERILRGYEINTVVSILISSIDTSETKFLCKECGNKKKTISILKTLFLCLWSRRGILLTPITLIKDLFNLFFAKKISNRIFDEFIETNIGLIRLRGKTKEVLNNLIINHNNKTE